MIVTAAMSKDARERFLRRLKSMYDGLVTMPYGNSAAETLSVTDSL